MKRRTEVVETYITLKGNLVETYTSMNGNLVVANGQGTGSGEGGGV